MASHKSFRAWQGARELVIQVQRVSPRIWRPYRGAMIEQLQRSSLSVQLNVAEGYALGTTAQFVRHLNIAYGSAIETVEIVELLQELCEDQKNELETMAARADRNCALVLALKHQMKRRLDDGQ
jgi:four helix bundle protein